VGQLLDQETIAREKQEPFAVSVETADITEASPARGQEIVNGLASPGIGRGAEKSSRLVEKNRKGRRGMHRTTIDGNRVPLLDLHGEAVLDPPVDRHPAAEDERFHAPAGSEAAAS
jgi:hypothetical protein